MSSGHFVAKSIKQISDIKVGDKLDKSDLCLQNGNSIAQFEYISDTSVEEIVVKPGTWELHSTSMGVSLLEVNLHKRPLLMNITNARPLIEEVDRFHKKLHVYAELERPAKRSVLMYSAPGMGKSSTITHFCNSRIAQDPGTVVIIWPTASVDSNEVSDFFSSICRFNQDCTNLILVMEDIGGGEQEGSMMPRRSDSSLLNFLDGIKVTFKLPTFIVATTNHPENLLEQLVDRPGRFDMVLEIKPPSANDRADLIEFISRRKMTPDETKLIKSSKTENFSIAHLEEIVIRSRLHDKSYEEVVKEINTYREKVKNAFNKDRRMGFENDD